MLDEETKELAALALRNAFWLDFSGLVNKYLAASKGIDIDDQKMQMGEMTSIYGTQGKQDIDLNLNIWTKNLDGGFSTCGHGTLIEALEHAPALEVHLRGKKVFEKRPDIGWYFVG